MSDNSDAALQRDSNGKMPGGITGLGFVKGRSGNPSGRRKDSPSLVSWLKRTLAREPKRLAALGDALLDAATAGDTTALRLILERLDGKPTETLVASVEQRDSGILTPALMSRVRVLAAEQEQWRKRLIAEHARPSPSERDRPL